MTLTGIDVSKWQDHLPALDGLSFLFARATIGTQTDERYFQHVNAASSAGLIVGAYHFNHDAISVASQVRQFLATAGDVDLYAVDVEGLNAFSQAQTRAFIDGVHQAGKRCGLYHSASGFFDAGQDFDWVAKWSTIPPTSWDFWQFTSGGRLPGYAGRLDMNRYNGTIDELRTLAGRDDDMATQIPVDYYGPWTVDIAVGVQLYDLAGKPLVKVTNEQRDRPAPSESNNVNATPMLLVMVQTGGMNQYVYVKSSDVTDRRKVAADCSAEQARIDGAIAVLQGG